MMGRLEAQENLFYRFRIEDHVPKDHLLCKIDRLLDFDVIRHELADLYSHTGRPSIDPELMLRMLLVGYLYGIRSDGDWSKRLISIWRIGGFASWDWRAVCRIARHFPRTVMVALPMAT